MRALPGICRDSYQDPVPLMVDFDDTFADLAGADQDDPAAAITDLEYNDLCSDFDAGGNFHIALASKTYPCNVAFNMRRLCHKLKVGLKKLKDALCVTALIHARYVA